MGVGGPARAGGQADTVQQEARHLLRSGQRPSHPPSPGAQGSEWQVALHLRFQKLLPFTDPSCPDVYLGFAVPVTRKSKDWNMGFQDTVYFYIQLT